MRMRLDKDRTALLIIDMQTYQAAKGGNLPRFFGLVSGPEAETGAVRKGKELIPVIKKLLSAFRAGGMKVIYMAFGSLTEDGADLVPYVRRWNERSRAGLGSPAIVSIHDPGYGIIRPLAPRPDEPVINKTAQGAFNSSAIDHVLKQMGIDSLVVVGMYTNHCVMATCIGAADAGYRVIVPEDAVGTWHPDLHEKTLLLMRPWIIRTDSAAILEVIQSLASGADPSS
ncbi:MAG: isochorismatase family cysteine hydrolase [Syntrophales bacterium]|nr:isochorismatase family cysteine hydrolase [Syntrophales bacterium]